MGMNILVLSSNAALGGASRSLGLMIEHLTKLGNRILVLAPRGNSLKLWEAAGAENLYWSPPTCSWLGHPVFATYAGEFSLDRLIYNLLDLFLLPFRLNKADKT